MFKNKIKFPPDFPGLKPKQKKKYKHHVLVSSRNREIPYQELRDLALEVLANDEKSTKDFANYFLPVFRLDFTSEKQAAEAKRVLGKATNNVIVEREKQEIPVMTEEGVIL